MCTYLSRRGATYYFRRPVPDDVQLALGSKAWVYSLRTKDRAEGKRAAQAETVCTNALIDNARAPAAAAFAVLDAPTVDYLADTYRATLLAADDAERWGTSHPVDSAADRKDQHQANEDGWQSIREDRDSLSAVATLGEEALLLGRDCGLKLDPQSPAFIRLCLALINVHTEVAETIVARDNDRHRPTPAMPVPITGSATPTQASPAVTVMSLFDGYVAERNPSPSTVRNWRPYMASFVASLGHSDASRVVSQDVRAWRDKLLREPGAKGKVLAPRTVNDGCLAALKTVFEWGVDNQQIEENPAKSVRVRMGKSQVLRDRGFVKQEALTILSAARQLIDTGASSQRDLARGWVPWLCGHTGARVNEITQLRAGDVRFDDGVWTINITPEAGTVKTGAARIVPLHPQLIELGFGAMAQARGDGPLFYDPSRQRKPGPGNRQFKKVGEDVAAWVRSLGVTDPNVSPNHGWRHAFKTRARLAGVDASASDVIQGHAATSQGQKYGYIPITVLASEMAKMPYFETAVADEPSLPGGVGRPSSA